VVRDIRELIAEGEEIHWYCRMGRAADDGTFEEFKAAVMAEGPQTVEPDLLPENRHYDSPFCVADFDQPTMDIRYKDYVMRLDFSSEHEGEA